VARLLEARKSSGKEIKKHAQAEPADERVEEWIEELIDENEEVVVG
jgi:translation initiation factor 3 subunit B